MFCLEKDNQKIGAYIKELIEKKYASHRQFCKAYILAAGGEVNDEELRKMGNRLSQIIKGKKAIQIYDLPIFTDLLGVSCEEILSSGKNKVPVSAHVTNYGVAFSKDRDTWEKYANREDKLILNYDEYGKSVIDYAFEFENYDFLKFLMDEGYIWFVDNSGWSDQGYTYGAGTSIKRRDPGFTDSSVPLQIQYEDRLRTQTIALAIENEDFSILEKLCARENPALHEASIVGFPKVDMGKYRNEDLINAIASSEGRILDFFTEEFSVINRYKRTNTFIFPYIGNVIDQMLQNGRKEVEKLLVASVHHNRKTYKQLKALVDEAHEFQCSFFDDIDEETSKEMMKKVRRDINMDESNSIISFYDSRGKYDSRGLVTNIVRTVCSSTNPSIKRLVEELNDLYRQIINLKEGDDENGEAIL